MINNSRVFKQLKKLIDEENKKIPEAIRMYMDLQNKIMKRCLLEGCVYGYPTMNTKPKKKCIYCDTPRKEELVFFDSSIMKSLNLNELTRKP